MLPRGCFAVLAAESTAWFRWALSCPRAGVRAGLVPKALLFLRVPPAASGNAAAVLVSRYFSHYRARWRLAAGDLRKVAFKFEETECYLQRKPLTFCFSLHNGFVPRVSKQWLVFEELHGWGPGHRLDQTQPKANAGLLAP